MELPAPDAEAISILTDDLLRAILRRLSLADLLRAALACHRWRRLAARCIPRAPPLLGYFFHPVSVSSPLPIPDLNRALYPAEFAPLNTYSPRLSLNFAPDLSQFNMYDCHKGLLLFEHMRRSEGVGGVLPQLRILDPALRRHVLLPPPPMHHTGRDHSSSYYVGSALLSRAHPTRLHFEAVWLAIDGGHPRAWVASVDDGGECRWRALPQDKEVAVDFDPWRFDARCVHAAGAMYWHVCSSGRLLALDPVALRFSYLLAPAVLGEERYKYRIGELPEDGRLCIASVENEILQIWVYGEGSTDNGWSLNLKMDLQNRWNREPNIQ